MSTAGPGHSHAAVADAARAALLSDPLVAAERAETLAEEASELADLRDAASEEASAANEEALAELRRAEAKARATKDEARTLAAAAANARMEAYRLDKVALAARRDADAKPLGSPTAAAGSRMSKGFSGVWDVHVAVHCVKPTGKSQREVRQMQKAVTDAKDDADAVVMQWQDTSKALAHARAEVKRLERDEARFREAKENALANLQVLIEQQRAEAHKLRAPLFYPHTPHTMRAAWSQVLKPIERRLTSLHNRGVVDFGVAGFVHSDAESWRRFWRPVRDARGKHAVACIAPHGECACALCASRVADTKRAGARASSGEGGAFVSSLPPDDEERAVLTSSTLTSGLAACGTASGTAAYGMASGTADATAGGGPPDFRVGTRVSGVVRVRADSAGAALDFICDQLVSALHQARGPPDIPESERSRRDGLYDVTWSSGGKYFHSASAAVSGPGSPRGSLSPARSPPPRSPRRSLSPASPRRASCSSPRRSPTGRSPSPSRYQHGDSAHAQTTQREGRPYKGNPHAALLLDVQTRLLRTTGSSFSYVSGRSQSDDTLPWIGVGRQKQDFEADRDDFAAQFRPATGAQSHGGLRSSPAQQQRLSSASSPAVGMSPQCATELSPPPTASWMKREEATAAAATALTPSSPFSHHPTPDDDDELTPRGGAGASTSFEETHSPPRPPPIELLESHEGGRGHFGSTPPSPLPAALGIYANHEAYDPTQRNFSSLRTPSPRGRDGSPTHRRTYSR